MPPLTWPTYWPFLPIAFGVNCCGHAWLSFAEHQARTWASAARFFTVASLSFAVNETLYAIALQRLHWHYFWSQAAILVLVAVGTFTLSKFWAFQPATPMNPPSHPIVLCVDDFALHPLIDQAVLQLASKGRHQRHQLHEHRPALADGARTI